MMPSRFVSLLMAALLGSASAALAQPASAPAAQDAPSTTVAPVTVTVQATPKAIISQSDSFVQHYSAVSSPEIDQIGRWRDPVCVQVEGLVPKQAALIKARIEEVAQEVGLRAARAGCKANVEIVFADKPQAAMDAVARRREYLLGYEHRHNRDRLKTVTRPIQSWYVTSTRSTSSGNIAALVEAGIAVQLHLSVVDDPDNMPPMGCMSNPFTHCYASAFENVFIAADSKVLEGKNLGLVADYMVMLALSKPRSLDGCNALPSVVDRFAQTACPGRDPPDGLTPADASYLTALYAADLEGIKNFEWSDITRRMAAILIKASAKEPQPGH
jgi:hypothetical protein